MASVRKRPGVKAQPASDAPNYPHNDPDFYETGVHVFADGACEPNPGPGAWGFCVYVNGVEIHSDSGTDEDASNNSMELMAALKALEWIEQNHSGRMIELHSDSRYVVDGLNEWRHSWKARGWKRGGQGEVKNLDLWLELDKVLMRHPLKLRWVKGHCGIKGNERADELCMLALAGPKADEGGDYLTDLYRELFRE